MQVIVNYEKDSEKYLPTLEYMLNKVGATGMKLSTTLSPLEAVSIANKVGASAILLCNTASLKKFVDDPKPSLSSWRGSRLPTSVPTIVLDNPANIFSMKEGRFIFGKDIEKLRHINKPIEQFKFTVLRTVHTFAKCLEQAKSAFAIGLDIETNQWNIKVKSSKKPVHDPETLDIAGLGETWITCVSICLMDRKGNLSTYVLPLVNGMHDYWESDVEYIAAINLLKAICELEIPKCFHNGMYDIFHLIRYQIYPRYYNLDTLALSWSWYSELDKDLSFMASWLLPDYYYWKWLADKEHKAIGNVEDYWKYAGLDTWYMMRCLKLLLANGDSWMLTNYAKQFPLVYPSTYGAFEGILINNDTRKRLLSEAQERLEKNKAALCTMVDDPKFNPASSQQVAEFMYNTLGAARPPRAKTASASGKKERTYVASQHPWLAMFVDYVNKFAKDAKAISTYYQFIQWNSRLMWSLNPFGTETSRFASRASHAWVGTQIQNQPYYAKEMYIPDPGYIGFEIDYSKAEAICTAYLFECLPLIKALTDPDLDANGKKKDFYKVLGEKFFQMKYEEVTTEFRNKVLKKIQHGTNYMMAGNTFIDNLEDIGILFFAAGVLGIVITPNPKAPNEMTAKQFADKLLASYHIPFPEVSQGWHKIKNEVSATSMLVNPSGFVRYFFGDPSKDHAVWRSAVAHLPQSTSVANLNKGYLRAYDFAASLEDKSILRIKTQIHDSIKGQVKVEYAQEVIPRLAQLVEARQVIHGREMIIPVEVEVYNTNWKEKMPWKDFSETILPTLGSQKSLTFTTVGRLSQ